LLAGTSERHEENDHRGNMSRFHHHPARFDRVKRAVVALMQMHGAYRMRANLDRRRDELRESSNHRASG
jgi:hypothetical protein